MKVIHGPKHPKAEEKTMFQVEALNDFSANPFIPRPDEKFTWTLYKSVKGQWKKIEGNIKYGKKVPYTFGEKVVGIPFKIEVHKEVKDFLNQYENKLFATLIVTPRTSKEPIIGRVILLNRGKDNVNKATFNETLTAEARTSNMFGKEITFNLWEEGASEAEKYKKPKTAKVDKNGIAKVQFSLVEYASQPTMLSVFSSASSSKRFYVTASYGVKEVTNIGAVTAIETAAQTSSPDKSSGTSVYEVIGKTADITAKGLKDLANYFTDKKRTATSVNDQTIGKNHKEKCPRCEADVTYDQIVEIFPSASKNETLAKELIKEINGIKIQYGIDTCLKKAHMITQMGSETEFRTLKEEIDKYSIKTLKSLFGYFKRHPDEAAKYHGDLYQIAIRAYGLRKVDKEKDIVSCSISNVARCNDLGNESKEDGYTYIGRGLIQLTGKYQYTQINKSFQKAFPNHGNLISNPELLEQPKYAVMSGLSYWINNNLNEKAQKGSEGTHVDGLTRVINKNLDESHYKKRRTFFTKAKNVFKIDECTNRKKEERVDNGVEVVFDVGTNKAIVSEKSINILKKIAKASNSPRIVITSTARTPLEQATIMHDQTIEKGIQPQKVLYGSNGDLVIDVYIYQKSLGKSREEIIQKMEEKINNMGPSKVSRHCGNQSVLNVFDVSSRRMSNAPSFLREARKLVGKGISVLLNETDRNCYHFEIPQ